MGEESSIEGGPGSAGPPVPLPAVAPVPPGSAAGLPPGSPPEPGAGVELEVGARPDSSGLSVIWESFPSAPQAQDSKTVTHVRRKASIAPSVAPTTTAGKPHRRVAFYGYAPTRCSGRNALSAFAGAGLRPIQILHDTLQLR